jgi:hypothetical protein
MNTKLNYILSFFLISSLVSCDNFFETTLEIYPPKQVESLVLNGSGIVGRREILFRITESLPIFSNQAFLVPDNLVIKVTHNSNVMKVEEIKDPNTTKITNHKAILNNALKVGDIITITAAHPKYKSISVTDTVPENVEILDAIYTEEGGKDMDGEFSIVEFNIKPKRNNFYVEMSLSTLNPRCLDSECKKIDTVYSRRRLEFNDPNIITNRNAYIKSDGNLSTKYYRGTSNRNLIGPTFIKKPKLTVVALNKKSYDHFISKKLYDDANENPFATPVNLVSNVENGFGHFGLYNVKEVFMKEQ